MSATKQKIIETAVALFNGQGLANVRLQQIAEAVGISTGNLAYHFANKEAIVQAVYGQLAEELAGALRLYSVYPNLLDFDLQVSRLFQVFRSYPFYPSDLPEIYRSYPALRESSQAFFSKLTSQLEKRVEFNVKRGIIMPEPAPHLYRKVAEAMVLTLTFRATGRTLAGLDAEGEPGFKEALWLHLSPYLTPKGRQEYAQLIEPLLQD